MGGVKRQGDAEPVFRSRMNVYPPQVPLTQGWGRLPGGIHAVVAVGLCLSGGTGSSAPRPQVLRITGHDRQSEPRQRLAWPVTGGSGIGKIFGTRKSFTGRICSWICFRICENMLRIGLV
ncbi:hypothetical protein NNRS527_03166 (plasmid) [Nitrosospira sp. NRS527]|nr:hypothetical protein NNRS527_03166 [Nitrosospira sp. NRS527]